MRSHILRLSVFTVFLIVCAANQARAQICVSIDEAHDTLSPDSRTAALFFLARQFELAGKLVASGDCAETYVVSHVRLGNTISVTLSGPLGHRDGTALGLDDLPAVYSQMVRSLVTGRSMGSMSVVDRTNVTASQDLPPRRVQSDSFGYARLGYGGTFGDRTYGAPAMGLGYRAEFDSFGIDVSFFNFQFDTGGGYYASRSAFAGSWLKLEGLYFTSPVANRTAYFGGGMSWGGTSVQSGTRQWDGHGLQGELTAGYELARATTVRLFVQGDAVLPFYTSEALVYHQRVVNGRYVAPTITTERRYTPSVVISVGLGWQRSKSRH